MTKVELAEGRLLNEIHEHASLGITMALEELISAVEAQGEVKGHVEGVAEGGEKERMKVLSEASFLRHDFDARESAYFYGEREDNGDIDVLAREDCYIVPASVLAPPKEREA